MFREAVYLEYLHQWLCVFCFSLALALYFKGLRLTLCIPASSGKGSTETSALYPHVFSEADLRPHRRFRTISWYHPLSADFRSFRYYAVPRNC